MSDIFEPRGGSNPMSVQPCRAGATAVIGGRMPNGHLFGYVKECSLPTGWTEDGKELSGRSVYDLVGHGALVPCSDDDFDIMTAEIPVPDIGLSKGHKPADTLREYAALCRKAVEAANRYRHAVLDMRDIDDAEKKFIDLYNAIWKHPEDDATLVYMDRE